MKALLLAVILGLTLLLASRPARAETLQAPVAGKATLVGDGRVVCPGTSGDWAVEQEGHAVRPPATDDSIGKAVEARVAASTAACTTSSTPVTLVATGRWPTIDAAGSSLFVDDARIELHGRNLRGAIVHWQLGDRSGEDRCVQAQTDPTGEKCAVAVGRGLPADPGAADL